MCNLSFLPTDQIEQHVERAAVEVEKGRSELGTAVRYKVQNGGLKSCPFNILFI